MKHPEQYQLFAGCLRSLIWRLGAYVSLDQKRLLLVIGFGLAGATSLVFALADANVVMDEDVFRATAYASTITPGLIVASLIMTARSPRLWRQWRL